MDDDRLIEAFFARSERAIDELSARYGTLCIRTAENILGDRRDAEECVNDAYLAVWHAIPPARPKPLAGYVCRIVRNLAVKRYRSNTAKKRNGTYDAALDELSEILPDSARVEDGPEAKELAAAVNAFLATREKKDRIMFVRRYWHADRIAQIAALFGMREHAVSVRLSRTRKALQAYLIKEGIV